MRGGFVHRVRFVVTGKTPLKDKIMITLSSAQRCKEAEKSCGHVVPIFTAVSEMISITCGVMWNEVGCIPRVLNSCFVLKTSGTQWKVFFFTSNVLFASCHCRLKQFVFVFVSVLMDVWNQSAHFIVLRFDNKRKSNKLFAGCQCCTKHCSKDFYLLPNLFSMREACRFSPISTRLI